MCLESKDQTIVQDQIEVDCGLQDLTDRLVCPIHGAELRFPHGFRACGVPWPDGDIFCGAQCHFKIRGGIPRLVNEDNYSDAFGLQWQRYQKTQLDSYTGHPISIKRLERCLGISVCDLKNKKVLECGSGAGRFTEHLLGNSRLLVSMDMSSAVDANLRNLRGKSPYILLQGDINNSPLPEAYFDVVICLGVIQHTPSPEQTIVSLVRHLAPGGLLVVDHYTHLHPLSRLGELISMKPTLRAILKRLPSKWGLRATNVITAVCDPIRRHTCKRPWLDRVAVRMFPSACYYNEYPQMLSSIVYEWNELDTHDSLTDFYKHRRTANQLQKSLQELGLSDVTCEVGGNGIEVRASRPA